MKIHEVQENLKNTIKGKERMLAQYQSALACSYAGPTPPAGAEMACIATIQFLEINIDELKRILQDVDKAVEQYNELAWTINPDRSGGAFTDEAINWANEWR